MANEEQKSTMLTEEENVEAPAEETKAVESADVGETEIIENEEDTDDTTTEFKNSFQMKIAAMSEKQWKTVQTIVGVLMGLVVVLCLGGGSENGSSMSFTIYAAVIALVVPKILEKSCDRDLMFGKMVMLITLAIGVVGQLVLHLTGVI